MFQKHLKTPRFDGETSALVGYILFNQKKVWKSNLVKSQIKLNIYVWLAQIPFNGTIEIYGWHGGDIWRPEATRVGQALPFYREAQKLLQRALKQLPGRAKVFAVEVGGKWWRDVDTLPPKYGF